MKTKKLELTNDQNYFLYWILSENDCSDWVNEFFNWHDFRILLNYKMKVEYGIIAMV